MATRNPLENLMEVAANKEYGLSLADLNTEQLYHSLAVVLRNKLLEKRKAFNKKYKMVDQKRVHYLSMEFLMGRSLKNNVYNLQLNDDVNEILAKYNHTLDELYECEPDAGLGNGGLGRLAACYLDGLATQGYPSMGHSILFDYGLFQQKLVDGWQTELPDNWLPGGKVWLKERADKAVLVKFGGTLHEEWTNHGAEYKLEGCQEIEALPFDMMVSGYKSSAVSVLRLWKSRNNHKFDYSAFGEGKFTAAVNEQVQASLLTKVLYPSDAHEEGKELRLKQEYFLVSAAMQCVVRDYFKLYANLDKFAERVAVHINDTHPALAVPELMRIFVDEYRLDWDYAWDIVTKTCAFTNHTLMSEALECWDKSMFRRILPRIYMIVKEINERACKVFWEQTHDWDKVSNMAIVAYSQVRMANLAVIGSHSVNGVSGLHSEIVKQELFNNFYSVDNDKFTNVTNGIAHRRWLCQANPRLTSMITELIGTRFIKDASKLQGLNKYVDDSTVIAQLEAIKHANKVDFANMLARKSGQAIDPNTRFDVQVKRLHEYKRQLLNVLKIVNLFCELKKNPDLDITPQTFIFGAKAASSYLHAKEVIKLIYCISKEIEKNPKMREKINVVFLENYCVSLAECLMPASEVSQQISLAGKEASGTGNMKFMINGALTVGTLDGANVEMSESVGMDNIFIFGMHTEDVAEHRARGYNPAEYYFKDARLRAIIDQLNSGFNGETFENISNYLLGSFGVADPYMCFADFDAYIATTDKMDAVYQDRNAWNKMALKNIAEAGRFGCDRAINEYAKDIWRM